MPSIRTLLLLALACLAAAVARAQVPTPDPAPQAPAATPAPALPEQNLAERQLDIAIVQVRGMERIAASIDMDVQMLNQKFKLDGNFYKDTGHRIRLQMKLTGLGDTDSKMVQVCDGKVLWDFQQVLNMQSFRRREITPILKKLDNPDLNDTFRIMIVSNMGFGGPEAMLLGLRKAIGFDQISEDKVEGVDVWVLRGTWRDRASLMGQGDRPLPPTAPLPPYVPANVAVYVGKLDGWPCRIEMIGNAQSMLAEETTREVDPATRRPIGQPKKVPRVDPTRVTLHYKLLPTTEINPGLFNFEPPANVAATSVKDETEEFLAGLDQYIQMEVARKKAEAAKAEGEPLLKTRPRDVPSAPPGGSPAPEGPAPR